ncbi:hypothetical protein APHAL10511_007870 [Amanita phalloides]|nr:hypothetical protein APHAL10511_007870 [Amanita phalloides]
MPMHSLLSRTPSSALTPSKAADNNHGSVLPTIVASNVSKEVRAYEHSRQRVKKTAETASLRVRKLASATKQLSLSHPRTPTNKVLKGTRISDDIADLDDPVVLDITHGDEQPELLKGRLEVSLADFIVTRKSRKGIDNDFEVIPHVRSVIILDDNQPHDIEIDEPWEYITGVEEDQGRSGSTKPISYAMVAAQAK